MSGRVCRDAPCLGGQGELKRVITGCGMLRKRCCGRELRLVGLLVTVPSGGGSGPGRPRSRLMLWGEQERRL